MKNSPMPPNLQAYVSTSQAAKMLGLSVGTVQRMVQKGIFKAFITHGGHRRILSTSLQDYFKAQGFAQANTPTGTALVCILHDSEHLSSPLSTLSHWEHVKVITHPLDLMGVEEDVGVFSSMPASPGCTPSPCTCTCKARACKTRNSSFTTACNCPPTAP